MSASVLERSGHLLSQGKGGEAVNLLEAALAAGGGSRHHVMLGYALYHERRTSDAIAVLSRAADIFPDDAFVHEALARMRWMNGDTEGFADRFIAAVSARPDDVELCVRCAELLRLAGFPARAETLLRAALTRVAGEPGLVATLGVLLDESGQLDEALQLNTRIYRTYRDTDSTLTLVHTLLRLGRADEALGLLAPIRRQAPDLQLAITYEAMALRQSGDPRHDWLCDYQRHVQVHDLEPPSGYDSIAAFNAELGDFLFGLMDAPGHPIEQSLRGGAQTGSNLVSHGAPILQSYFSALEAPIRAYTGSLGSDPSHPLERRKTAGHRLSGCWSVKLRPGGFHVNHTHPAGWLSSSYYVSLPDSVTADSQEGWIKFGEPRWPVPGCGVERAIQPKEGRLVLFPSYMWHGTIPFSSGERLTAPFDVVPA